MRRHLGTMAAAALAAAAISGDGLAQDALPPPPVVVREGEHFRVLCHFDTEHLADEALAAVEQVWDVAHALLPGAPVEAGVRDIHLYRNSSDYALADAQISGGQFPRNLAFSWEATRSSHVALQPDQDDAVFAATGLPALTLRTAIHEACHLVVYDNTPNHPHLPDWLHEGIATVVADRVMIASGLAPDAAAAPKSATRMVMAQRLLERGALPSPRAIITTDLESVSFDRRYAVWWLFFRYLADTDGGEPAATVLRTARDTVAGSGFRGRLAVGLEKTWGTRRLTAMNDEFRAYVKALRPEWEEVANTLAVRGNAWTQLAFTETNAIAWRREPVGRSQYTVGGTFEILHSPNPQLNLLLGRSGDDFVSLAFRADFGVTIFGYGSATDTWTRIGSLKTQAVKRGEPVPFEVSVSGSKLTLRVADEDPLSWTVEEHDLSGPWGVGAQAGGAGIWRDLEVR